MFMVLDQYIIEKLILEENSFLRRHTFFMLKITIDLQISL